MAKSKNPIGFGTENNPLGLGYLNDDGAPEPKQRKSITDYKKKEESHAPAKPVFTEQKNSSASFLDQIEKVLQAKPTTKEPVKKEQPAMPINPTKPSAPEPVVDASTTQEENPRSVKWRVPPGTKSVKVQICESNGRLINEYNISSFIKLSPGQILKVVAE